jgi:hypothetical protein
MMQRTQNAPPAAVVILLLAGLFPAGDTWYHTVAEPVLSNQFRYALPLFISNGTDETRENSAQNRVSGVCLQRAGAAMTLVLGADK